MNENEVVVEKGLAEGDQVLLSAPENKEKLPLVRLPDSPIPKTAGGDTAVGGHPIPPVATPAPAPTPPKKQG